MQVVIVREIFEIIPKIETAWNLLLTPIILAYLSWGDIWLITGEDGEQWPSTVNLDILTIVSFRRWTFPNLDAVSSIVRWNFRNAFKYRTYEWIQLKLTHKNVFCYLTVVASVKFLHKRPEEQITYNDMMRMSGKRNFRFPFMKECLVESGDHREIQGDKSKRCNINKNIKSEHCIHFVCYSIPRWQQISLFRIV